MTRLAGLDANTMAFLDMIAYSEGTAGRGDDGYNILVGGSLFDGYADHPRKVVRLNPGLSSTAAGRYQLLMRYFDAYKLVLKLPDFSPESQDAIAIQQIRECRALDLIAAGKCEEAVGKVAHIWASLPGAGYNQHENKMATLLAAYEKAGGIIT